MGLALSSPKNVPVSEITPDGLIFPMSQWSNRFGKRAYDPFADSGFTNGRDLADWFKLTASF